MVVHLFIFTRADHQPVRLRRVLRILSDSLVMPSDESGFSTLDVQVGGHTPTHKVGPPVTLDIQVSGSIHPHNVGPRVENIDGE